MMSSWLPVWDLNISVSLLNMTGQKALGFHQKYLNLCSKDEQRSFGFGKTWEWVINDIIFYSPSCHCCTQKRIFWTKQLTLTEKERKGMKMNKHTPGAVGSHFMLREQLGLQCLAQGSHHGHDIEGGERALDIHSPHLQSLTDLRLEPATFGLQVRLSIH